MTNTQNIQVRMDVETSGEVLKQRFILLAQSAAEASNEEAVIAATYPSNSTGDQNQLKYLLVLVPARFVPSTAVSGLHAPPGRWKSRFETPQSAPDIPLAPKRPIFTFALFAVLCR